MNLDAILPSWQQPIHMRRPRAKVMVRKLTLRSYIPQFMTINMI